MEEKRLVTETCYNMRALARQALRGRWGTAVLGLILMNLMSNIPVMVIGAIFGESNPINFIALMYEILISGPLYLGYGMLTLHIFRGAQASPGEVVYGFERFGKAFGVYALMLLIVFVSTFIVCIPIVLLLAVFLQVLSYSMLILISWIALLGVAAWSIAVRLRYTLVYFIMLDHPELDPWETLRTSSRMMDGNKVKLFLLQLSYFGWLFLFGAVILITLSISVLLTLLCMIPALWLWAYIAQANAAFYEILNGNLTVEKVGVVSGGSSIQNGAMQTSLVEDANQEMKSSNDHSSIPVSLEKPAASADDSTSEASAVSEESILEEDPEKGGAKQE